MRLVSMSERLSFRFFAALLSKVWFAFSVGCEIADEFKAEGLETSNRDLS